MENDLPKIHIWQLPEKDEIDKLNDIAIVHDGTLRKIKMQKLYDYFNQDYKVESIVAQFNERLKSIEEEYNLQYELLKSSIENYKIVVKELQDKFKVNEDNIRKLNRQINELETNINDIDASFISLQNQCKILKDNLNNFKIRILKLKTVCDNHTEYIKMLIKNTEELKNDSEIISSNFDNMKIQIENMSKKQSENIQNKKEELITKINDEYDRILSIIDRYHHIHDIKYKSREVKR